MKVGIIGLGIVGTAVKFGFEKKQGHQVYVHSRSLKNTSIEKVFKNSDLIFVCVGTPAKKDGSCDTHNVLSVCGEINEHAKKAGVIKDVVIKSTVEPGTTQKLQKKFTNLRLAMNPEFLKENAAIHDFCNQDICVIGTDSDELFAKIVKAHGNLAKDYIKTTIINAEMVKYFTNVFNSTRVMFSNLFYDIAEKTGADYEELKSIAVKRYNMIDYYLDCNPNLRGYGGACLPKDTLATRALTKKLGINYLFLDGMIKDNNRLNKDFPDSN